LDEDRGWAFFFDSCKVRILTDAPDLREKRIVIAVFLNG
jgi:hypothetical protein